MKHLKTIGVAVLFLGMVMTHLLLLRVAQNQSNIMKILQLQEKRLQALEKK
jgi:hypothetical protein